MDSERTGQDGAHFGPNLDCRDGASIHTCGVLRFDGGEDGKLVSASLMQTAVGATKQDIVSALFNKYGKADDKFDQYLFRTFAADQYVWGSFTEASEIPSGNFTKISGAKHWQVQAIIAEPDNTRKTVIVQISKIDEPQTGGVSGGGIKF